MEQTVVRCVRVVIVVVLAFGLIALIAFGPAPARGGLGTTASISTETAADYCGSQLSAAMRSLQADVTGPLAEADYQRIRTLFAPLCSR